MPDMMTSTQGMYGELRTLLRKNSGLALWALEMMLIELGLEWKVRVGLAERIVKTIYEIDYEPLAAHSVHALLGECAKQIAEKLEGRARQVFAQVRPYLDPGRGPTITTVLDFGCGDGQVGERAFDFGADVQLYDCVDYRVERLRGLVGAIPFTSDWAQIAKQSYEVGLAVAVLHHCDNPAQELQKLASIAKRLVIIESVIDAAKMPWPVQAMVDWVYNRGMHSRANIPVPGNFRSVADWKTLFKAHGLRVVNEENLGIDLPLVPEHHHLFVLEH